MPLFRYTADDARYYLDLGVEAEHGTVVDVPEAPDGHWESADASAEVTPVNEPEPVADAPTDPPADVPAVTDPETGA